MKQYGANKATEFSKWNLSPLYKMAKNQDIKIEKWVVSEFYDLADYYGFDDNHSVEDMEVKILRILDCISANEIAEAQKWINEYTKHGFELKGRKAQAKCNHELVK